MDDPSPFIFRIEDEVVSEAELLETLELAPDYLERIKAEMLEAGPSGAFISSVEGVIWGVEVKA